MGLGTVVTGIRVCERIRLVMHWRRVNTLVKPTLTLNLNLILILNPNLESNP